MAYDKHWADIRLTYRRKVAQTLDAIESGQVEEVALHKLRNFCMTCLMLMSKVPEPVWRKAERDAELADMIRETPMDEPPDDTADT